MRYQLKESIMLEWPLFYVVSRMDSQDYSWEKGDSYKYYDHELWIAIESKSDGSDGDDLKLTVLSDSIELSDPGSYAPVIQSSELVFQGTLQTPEGDFDYYEGEATLVNGTSSIELKIYRAAEKELTILVEATGDKL